MTEDEANDWIKARFDVSRETALQEFVALVRNEADSQNLVSAATIPRIWVRHIVDSAQLLDCIDVSPHASWLDIGSGAGFPGIVIAILSDHAVTLVEPRRRRVEFLQSCVAKLGLGSRVRVISASIEKFNGAADAISARAVASISRILAATEHIATSETQFVLPKGRSAAIEVAEAQRAWHGTFHLQPSQTESGSMIVIARGVRPR